ncbi:MAG TPA: hypothetical protein VJH95_01870 [Candidatus Nanoarchaeia archaeon]|nr:hypothetical protein [Candidatus Nanoarchaeia archaeon]
MLQEHSQIASLLAKSNQHFTTADHIAYVTYPLVKDQKLIVAVLENLYLSALTAVEALLYYERLYKRIGMFPENFHVRLDLFKTKIAPQYNIERSHLVLLEELRQLVNERKASKMEFFRKDNYILCNQDYSKMKIITMEKLKTYINQLKPFMRKVNLILQNVRRQ